MTAAMDISLPGSDWPPNEGAKRVVHVDADMLVYSCGFAAEGEPLEYNLQTVKQNLKHVIERSGADRWVCHLTSATAEDNFRTGLATIQPYKGNRKDSKKPTYYREIREYFIEHWNGIVHVGYEADDALSIHHYHFAREPRTLANFSTPIAPEGNLEGEPESLVIATADKDLKGVRGATIYNTKHDFTKYYCPIEATRFFYLQCLTGDSADHIKGLGCNREESRYMGKSIGPKDWRVTDLEEMELEEEMYGHVLDCYKERLGVAKENWGKLSEPLAKMVEMGAVEALKENARLLYMLEYPGQLWEPPSGS